MALNAKEFEAVIRQAAQEGKRHLGSKEGLTNGLRLRLDAKGSPVWEVKFSVNNADRVATLDRRYAPQTSTTSLSLKDALLEAAKIKAAARAGVDHNQDKRDRLEADRLKRAEAYTVRDLYAEWFPTVSVKRGRKGRKDGGAEIERTFAKFVLGQVGGKLLTGLYASDIRPILTRISDAGNNRQATALLTDLKQMFRWGDTNQPWKRLLAASDVLAIKPEDIVAGTYDPSRDNERTRVLTESEVTALAALLPRADLSASIQAAIWIMLSVGTRVGETVATRWTHVDLDTGKWLIPSEHTKSGVALEVTLSAFALIQFRRQWAARAQLSADERSDYVFPSRTDRTKPLDNQTVGKALAARQKPGQKPMPGRTQLVDALVLPGGVWKCHDLRRTCSTLMQSLGVAESTAHKCLNHAVADKLTRIYMQHDYADEMAEAWRLLGDRLTVLTRPALH
jgi:integrase